MSDPVKQIREYQTDLLTLLREFFEKVTGESATEFSSVEGFADAVHDKAEAMVPGSYDAYKWFDRAIRDFYVGRSHLAFGAAKELGGVRLIHGGGTRIQGSQFRSVTVASLYADTILVPDPVMPWIEKDRSEEGFKHVWLLQAAHSVLSLEPLISSPSENLSLVVIPSFEKLLEENDETTQRGQHQLVVDVFSQVLNRPFGSTDELVEFVDSNPAEFWKAVEREQAFVAPDGTIGEPLDVAVEKYLDYIDHWRAPEMKQQCREMSRERLVLLGIWERLGHQYHAIENIEELGAHPLFSVPQTAHYFDLIGKASSKRLNALDLLDPRTIAAVRSLQMNRLEWLARIGIQDVARLKCEGEYVSFRDRVNVAITHLHESSLSDLDRVTAEVCHELGAMIDQHRSAEEKLRATYQRKHGETLGVGVLTAAVTFTPALAPFLGSLVPLAFGVKYGIDKTQERAALAAHSCSLTGVLAVAKSASS